MIGFNVYQKLLMVMILITYLVVTKLVCFLKALPDKSLALYREDCKGGKKWKERFYHFILCPSYWQRETETVDNQ